MFAKWIAQHPTVGVASMLRLTRSSLPHMPRPPHSIAAARLALILPAGNRAEATLELHRHVANVEAAEAAFALHNASRDIRSNASCAMLRPNASVHLSATAWSLDSGQRPRA